MKINDTPYKDWHTDKYITGLIAYYEQLFAGLKDKPIRYLEIGVAHGESMQWAKKYFSQDSLIIGVDIHEPDLLPNDSLFFVIDQSDTNGLVALGEKYGPFDIIIDDASHVRSLTENTFNALFRYRKADGYYIIEDWGAGYLPQNTHCKGMEQLVTDLIWKHGGLIIQKEANANTDRIEHGNCAIIG